MNIKNALCALVFVAGPACAEEWPALTSDEWAGLSRVLKASEKGSITVGCASHDCIALAHDVEDAFSRAGWHVTKVHHGGFGITGVQGLRIDACGIKEKSLYDALKTITSRQIEAIDDGDCAKVGTEINLTIGEKPQ